MSNIVIIGAGQTGRGYLKRFFPEEAVTFLDKDPALVDALTHTHSYKISFGAGEREPVTAENYRAYVADSKEGLQSLSEADLVLISVGRKNLKDVGSTLSATLASRKKEDLDILTAENGVNVKKDLQFLCKDPRVHLAEAIVFCTTLKQEDSLDILSENLDYLPYDVTALGHTLPYKNMAAEDQLDVLMQRKIYTYNCVSAIVSYLGYYKNYTVYSDAANDAEISRCIHQTLETLNQCICAEYGVSPEEQLRFSEMAVRKFQNKNIVDTIERNARDVDRKLGLTERILAPLSIVQKHGKTCEGLLLTAACAVYYGKQTDTLLKKPEAYFETLPEPWQTKIFEILDALEHQEYKFS